MSSRLILTAGIVAACTVLAGLPVKADDNAAFEASYFSGHADGRRNVCNSLRFMYPDVAANIDACVPDSPETRARRINECIARERGARPATGMIAWRFVCDLQVEK